MGELRLLYGVADIAYIGGSLIERGGHNMIEAAAWGIPSVCGPHTYNFAEISENLITRSGMKVVNGQAELTALWHLWLSHPRDSQQVGKNAHTFFIESQGALKRLIDITYQQLNHQ